MNARTGGQGASGLHMTLCRIGKKKKVNREKITMVLMMRARMFGVDVAHVIFLLKQ